MRNKEEALSSYRLAKASIEGDNLAPDVGKHIAESIERLGSEDEKAASNNPAQALQNLRTYKIPRPQGVSGWGTFRPQITTEGVIASQQMSGEQKLASITKTINAMKFPELVPSQSKAHLLRSAVLSCSEGTTCELVLVPNSNLATEQH